MQEYLSVILKERVWSWTLVTIAYMIVTLFIRQLFFSKIAHQTKELDPVLYSAARKYYWAHSWTGWGLYLVSLSIVITVWFKWTGEFLELKTLVLAGLALPVVFLLSILFHQGAYLRGVLEALRLRMGPDREF